MPKLIGRQCNKLYMRLGLARSAKLKDIKHAYREKAKVFHPDLGGDAEMFSKIYEAYKVLSNKKARKRYDETGEYSSLYIDDSEITKSKANAIIISHFRDICSKHAEGVLFMDIFSEIRNKIHDDIEKISEDIKKYDAGLRLLKELFERVKYTGKQFNFIEGSMLNQMQINERLLKDLREDIKLSREAIKILKNYKFDKKHRPVEEFGKGFRTYVTYTAASGW